MKKVIVVIIVCISFTAGAQEKIKKFEIGASPALFIYQGDLTPEQLGAFKTMRVGIIIHGSKNLSSSFSLRTNLAIGGLRGDDAKYNNPEYRKQRNFNFRTPVVELSELLVWNAFGKNYAEKGVSPYFFAGAGISILKIKRDWSNYNAAYFGDGSEITAGLAADANHHLPKMIPVIPVGAGVRYEVSQRFAVNAEAAYRLVFTDYMDGFSRAANPNKNDHYHTTSIGAIYKMGIKNKLECPVIKY